MKTLKLITNNPDIELIEPDIDRDSKLGVTWINSPNGKETLRLMGVADKDNKPTTLQKEIDRVSDFITNNDQLNWMISYKKQVVGAVWIDLKNTDHLKGPSVHIMIGDPNVRGKGIGFTVIECVMNHLKHLKHELIYTRYITQNVGSKNLLNKVGFKEDDKPYKDKDGLNWQNVFLINE